MNITLITSSIHDAALSLDAVRDILTSSEHQVEAVEDNENLAVSLQQNRPDLVLIVGEDPSLGDGHIQELLDLFDIAYVGTSAQACRVISSKDALSFVVERSFKTADERINATWPKQFVIGPRELDALKQSNSFTALSESIPGGYPLVVTSDTDQWGSVAQVVEDEIELQQALEKTLDSTRQALVQPIIEGVGLTVCLLGQGWDAFVMPAVEICSSEGSDNSLAFGDCNATCYAPVRLESLSADQSDAQAIRAEIERAALDVYASSGMRDWGSVDIVWDGARAQVVGVHCVPSFLSGAPFERACSAVGLTFEGIINRIIDL